MELMELIKETFCEGQLCDAEQIINKSGGQVGNTFFHWLCLISHPFTFNALFAAEITLETEKFLTKYWEKHLKHNDS